MAAKNIPLIQSVKKNLQEGRPLVFGHRGARAYAPMNTLPSFELAIKQGATGIELDVQLSADREPVVIHDFTVEGSTDGSGAVQDLLLAELYEFNAAAKFEKMLPTLKEEQGGQEPGPFTRIRIPTLDEVFALVRDTSDETFIVNVELKVPLSMEAQSSEAARGIESVVADCIVRYGMEKRVLISSFNANTLRKFKALAPTIPIGFITDQASTFDTEEVLRDLVYEAWHPKHSIANRASMTEQIRAGRLVNVWTVNNGKEALRLTQDGASGIITDVPDRILAALGN